MLAYLQLRALLSFRRSVHLPLGFLISPQVQRWHLCAGLSPAQGPPELQKVYLAGLPVPKCNGSIWKFPG